ncbi:MAG: hypothetical protein M3280_07710 [Actinomycetota bacterium]|nr:hypothetical protein [Actinomycetota bacterium]
MPQGYKACPTCAKVVPLEAETCPNCGAGLTEDTDIDTATGSEGPVPSYPPPPAPGRRSALKTAILLSVLGIIGFVGYRIVSTVTTVTSAIEDSVDEALEASIGPDEQDEQTFPTPNQGFVQCISQLAVYVDTLLQSDGTEDKALVATYGRGSFEFRTVHRVYRRTSALIEAVGDEAAVDRAVSMLERACSRKYGEP